MQGSPAGRHDSGSPLLRYNDDGYSDTMQPHSEASGEHPGWLAGTLGGGSMRPSLPSPADPPSPSHRERSYMGYEPLQHKSPRVVKRQHTALATRARRTAWIVIDSSGTRTFLHADKRAVIQGLGLNIPIRDMRLMDTSLLSADTATLLVRDNAIIFSIDHVRLIVTADKALIPREGYEHNPLSNRFVEYLEEVVADWVRSQQEPPGGRAGADSDGAARVAAQFDRSGGGGATAGGVPVPGAGGALSPPLGPGGADPFQPLPFELVVLEAAFKEVVGVLRDAAKELEGVALPALDALTKSVSSANLERVRKVKTRHQRLLLRAEALRDEMERALGDDDDMAQMCLTRRKELADDMARAVAGGGEGGARTPALLGSSMPRRLGRAGFGGSPPRNGGGAALRADTPLPMAMGDDIDLEEEAQDVENLLESYYMQVDGLYDKLVGVGEYAKDTEEYINIELDAGRNRLIRLEIMLTAATFAIAPFNLLAGILGENLVIPSSLTQGVRSFYFLNAAAFALCFLFFYGIIAYMRARKLI